MSTYHSAFGYQVRDFVVSVLNDDEGISETAYLLVLNILNPILDDDILRGIKATDGRYYLPKDWKPDPA